MKKILSMVMVAVMMLALLASCATDSGNDKPGESTSAKNTPVKLVFKVGDEVLYDLSVTVNADTPTIADAIKTAAQEKKDIALDKAGKSLAQVKTYKACTLDVDGTEVNFSWACTRGKKPVVFNRLADTEIKADDTITFVFTRGAMDADGKFQEAPYDPSTNEYKDPAETTGAAA